MKARIIVIIRWRGGILSIRRLRLASARAPVALRQLEYIKLLSPRKDRAVRDKPPLPALPPGRTRARRSARKPVGMILFAGEADR